jgi:murein DD-endopeptidase MepM/ murein hydrolase activator NlpD
MNLAPARVQRCTRTALIISALATTAATVLAPTAAATTTSATSALASVQMPVLERGDRGWAVQVLQRRLGVAPTGWYGPVTFRKVVDFQKRHALRAKGYVGPLTWRALLQHPEPTRTSPTSRSRVGSARACPAPGAAVGGGWGVPRPGGRSHLGLDMMGRRGSPILAIEDAMVIREGQQSNGALRIVLKGVSGSKFYYGHMDRDLVRAGQKVRKGQVIGRMGDSGSPGAIHLHFEYWRSGGESDAVDAAPLIGRIC